MIVRIFRRIRRCGCGLDWGTQTTKEAKDDDEEKDENDDCDWPNLLPVSLSSSS